MMYGRYGNNFGPDFSSMPCFGNGFFHPFMMIGFLLIIALVVYLIFRSHKKSHVKSIESDALNILQMRFVKGEINEEEYLNKKNILKKD